MNQLFIMAKKPVAGAVKSRLAKSIGNIAALGVYRTLLTATVHNLAVDPRWKTTLAIAPDTALADPVWPAGIDQVAQGRGDLGQRMQRLFDLADPGPAIIIGTDIAFITRTDIADAFAKLGNNDLVFGDAGDGGYWLTGARRSPQVPVIFNNVRWSSPHTLTDTLANAKSLKMAWARKCFDIDDEEDYRRWRQER
jgi:rSAM/selenodomain-associated transferase 1